MLTHPTHRSQPEQTNFTPVSVVLHHRARARSAKRPFTCVVVWRQLQVGTYTGEQGGGFGIY